jgi:hypothetical protein
MRGLWRDISLSPLGDQIGDRLCIEGILAQETDGATSRYQLRELIAVA